VSRETRKHEESKEVSRHSDALKFLNPLSILLESRVFGKFDQVSQNAVFIGLGGRFAGLILQRASGLSGRHVLVRQILLSSLARRALLRESS